MHTSLHYVLLLQFLGDCRLLPVTFAIPEVNELLLVPNSNERRMPIVPDCWSSDRCCLTLYMTWAIFTYLTYLSLGLDIAPVVTSGSANFFTTRSSHLYFTCYDVRFQILIPTGIKPNKEVLSVGPFGLRCPDRYFVLILRGVQAELLPRIPKRKPKYVALDKGFCVPPLWAVVTHLTMFNRQCVETRYILWESLPSLYTTATFTTNPELLNSYDEGRNPVCALTYKQVNVQEIALYIVSGDLKQKYLLSEGANVSAITWNNTLTGPIFTGQGFLFRACATPGKFRADLRLTSLFDPEYDASKPELFGLPGPTDPAKSEGEKKDRAAPSGGCQGSVNDSEVQNP